MKIFIFATLFASIAWLQSAYDVCAQVTSDTIHELPEVVVTAKTFKEIIPAQKLSGNELKALSSFSVADAIRYFSGIQIKDYGGIGGLKTVNVRSMGTHHVGVFYDGIQLGNAQNGQIDLGKYSLDNIDEIAVYNGQKSDIFQSAKDFGTSASVYLRTQTPRFQKEKNTNLKSVLKAGSFHLMNPSILYEQKINDNLSFSANTEYIRSSGKYKYRYKRVMPGSQEVMYDTTAVRENGDIESFRLETGLYGLLAQGHWRMKSYYYNSERGIPGAIVNNKWLNSQRQWDRSFFVQGSAQKRWSNKLETLLNIKFANDHMRYLNPDTTLMFIDNSFNQKEMYFSMAGKYSITRNWDVTFAPDIQYNTLTSNLDGFVFPSRVTYLTALATAAEFGNFKAQGSILATWVRDKVKTGNSSIDEHAKAAPSKSEYTPAVFISYKPFFNHNFNIRAFYKQIFRLPTFNDLYYTDIGNIHLKPEFTHQYNLGFQYSRKPKGMIKELQLQTDVYYNEVTNKIVAVPKGSGQYRWMMMNLGYVEIRGIDASAAIAFEPVRDLLMNVRTNYTYQKAQDFTHRKSEILHQTTYGGQIPYIPRHNGSLIVNTNFHSWQLNYSFIYVGERYHNSANIRETYEQPWYTNDLTISKVLPSSRISKRIALEINNIFNQDYEVVLNYPMPGRNYKLSLTLEI